MGPFLFANIKCIILTLFILYTTVAQSQDIAVDWETLNQGEVLVEDVITASGIPGVRTLFVVKASRKAIWFTLLDYDNFPKFFKGIDKMKVLKQDENGALVEFWIDAVLMDLNYILYRDYAKPQYRLSWRQTTGDLKVIQGSWQILDTENEENKLLIYESYVDVGFFPVTWVIRQGAKRKAASMGYRLRDWLEKKQ